MSYQVLARKWRPASFEALVGQEHVLKALRHALDNERLHHAYLFTGTRGVGKTTIARILAKCLNCEPGVTATPCGVCASCVEISEGRSVDLIEVDAASRTKVEDTRELLDNVQYAPTRSRFKVYLIDEVHMLSGHSFNALLKTLEEPPEHVKFLLATTDPQKLPATVLSRCLQFNLKNLSAERVADHLRHVLGEERIAFDDAALWQLGRAAAGSMRDALSLTDQAIAYGDGALREADVASMLGTVDRGHVFRLLDSLVGDDAAAALACCDTMAERGVDYGMATDELMSVLHRTAIAQTVPDAVDPELGDGERIVDLAARMTAEDVQLFYELAQASRARFVDAPDPKQAFEMLVLRLFAFRPVAVLDTALGPDDVEPLAPAAREGGAAAKKPEPPDAAAAPEPTAAAAAASSSRSEVDQQVPQPEVLDEGGARAGTPPWHEVLAALKLTGSARNVASHCVLNDCSATGWELLLDEKRASLFNDRHAALIGRALAEHFGREIRVEIRLGPVGGETPAARAQRLAAERLAAAERSIAGDPRVLALLEDFEGELVAGSVSVDKGADQQP
ncbi:MAG: DNA polymerase III subunit gamma/tau [Halieaceae bacterium]|jgi:DNA polymerase-3 subunit gamma/tau|nr:DNA polymerase III subunit gamma/tau [Halieaceae bacterium]